MRKAFSAVAFDKGRVGLNASCGVLQGFCELFEADECSASVGQEDGIARVSF